MGAAKVPPIDNALFARPAVADIEQEIKHAGDFIPLPYPVEIIDDDGTAGLAIPRGGISICAAATGHGKSTFLIDAAARLASAGHSVVFWTNEQTRAAVYMRLAGRLRLPVADVVSDSRVVVQDVGEYDSGALLDALGRGLRDVQRRPDVIMLDWLQMIGTDNGNGGGNSAEWYRLKAVVNGLKNAVQDTGTAIIAAAQFNRQVVNPARVGLGAMGDSVGISQLAHKIIGLWNCGKQCQWGAKGAFDNDSKRGSSAPGYTDAKVGGRAGLWCRIIKERHGRQITPATLELDARGALIGGTDGRAVILPPDDMAEDKAAGGGKARGRGTGRGGNPGAVDDDRLL